MNSSKNSEPSNNDLTCIPTSSSTSDMSNQRICSICSGPSNGFYFGVLSCRACASFYRRSALEKRKFLCRRFNNCNIIADGMRNSCRACRLRRCLEAGMDIECSSFESKANQSAIENTILDIDASSTNTSLISDDQNKFHVNISFDKTLPTINHYLNSLHNMEVGYKALSSVLGKWDPNHLDESHVYYIKLGEYIKIRRGEAMLVLSLIREHFPEFDKLSGQTQILILKNFAFRVLFMHRAEMTIKTFPEQNTNEINQLIIHPGCVIDGRRIELFIGEDAIQCFDDQKRHFYSLFEKNAKMTMEQYRPLDISPLEFAAIIGIQLWNCVERYAPQLNLISERRDQLYAELLSLLGQRLGADSNAIGVRYGRIMGLIQNITIHLHDVEEINTLLKIFMPVPFSDIWDELKDEKHFKNKEIIPMEVGK
ncbi:hypothetical protein ACQ4LE_004812 [Meloidogyne hapla]